MNANERLQKGALRVLKFGGTSVGSPERLLRVVEIIRSASEEGEVAVVVSAMQHTTDRLIEAASYAAAGDFAKAESVVDEAMDLAASNGIRVLQELESAKAIASGARPSLIPLCRELLNPLRRLLYAVSLLREQTDRTLDLALSFGEILSASVLTEILRASGLPAVFVDSRTWTVTDDKFGSAGVDRAATNAKLAELAPQWRGKLPVTSGFLGQTPDGRTTTLGRNGSDYTAALLASGLKASEVVVWTDVSGVMTADPNIVSDAYPLERLTYMEALEMSDFGAALFHPRTMIPLIESGIPMRICNTMRPSDPGTFIDAAGSQNPLSATSVTSIENLALIGVELRRIATASRAQISGRALAAVERCKATVWMSTLSAHGQAATMLLRQSDADRAVAALDEEFASELARGDLEPINVRRPVTLLSLVGEAMGRTTNVAGRFFNTLGSLGILIRASAQGASARSISCVIDAADTNLAVNSVHAAFNFAHQDVSLLVFGKGVVGSKLLEQIASQAERLRADHDVKLKVVGVADSRRAIFDEEGIDLSSYAERLARFGEKTDPDALLEKLRRQPAPILVDVTAADGMEEIYVKAFGKGIHVVAANKKPLCISREKREELFASARSACRVYAYSTTVGASLPVIETLKNIVRTGDRPLLVEGSFSGTIGYLVNEVMAGVPLSEATRKARADGYTEPNPQDDLAGTDVARKALILAREMGLPLELEDVKVEPLIPSELLEPMELEDFFAKLAKTDEAVASRAVSLRSKGMTLRYLARIEPSSERGAPKVTVAPAEVEAEHPAFRLRGAEAFAAFTTERYNERPLIVQGAGAGGAVTAAGVLADVLKIAFTLRGR